MTFSGVDQQPNKHLSRKAEVNTSLVSDVTYLVEIRSVGEDAWCSATCVTHGHSNFHCVCGFCSNDSWIITTELFLSLGLSLFE